MRIGHRKSEGVRPRGGRRERQERGRSAREQEHRGARAQGTVGGGVAGDLAEADGRPGWGCGCRP